MNTNLLTTLTCLALPLLISAQTESLIQRFGNQEKTGDKLFEKMAYQLAAETYEKAWESDPQNRISLKIADSYRMLNKPAEAALWYEIGMENAEDYEAEDNFYYAEALAQNGDYAEAKSAYQTYGKVATNDSRAPVKIKTIENQDKLYQSQGFVTVEEASFNSPESDFSPTFFEDGLVFASARPKAQLIKRKFAWDNSSFLDLYVYINNTVLEVEDNINSKLHEGPAVFFSDYSQMIFTRNSPNKGLKGTKDGVVKLKLYSTRKMDASGFWTTPEILSFNSDSFSCGHPTISKDGLTLYFAGDMPGGFGGTDLYKSEFVDGTWQKPTNLGKEINTEGDEQFPHLFDDTELFFASNGHGGLGGLDLFAAKLNKTGFDRVQNLGAGINSKRDDFGILLNDDGRSGYFSSNREGGTGLDDIYTFSSEKALTESFNAIGTVTDMLDGLPLAGVGIILLDEQQNQVATTTTSAEGTYAFPLEKGKIYSVQTAEKEGYESAVEKFNTVSPGDQIEWNTHLKMRKDHGFFLLGGVSSKDVGGGLSGVQITIIDNMKDAEVLNELNEADGTFTFPIESHELNDRISYQIKLQKEGYLSKSHTLNTSLDEPGLIDLNEKFDLSLEKLELGADIGKMAQINPIYFDSGKANIKPQAAAELQKIAQIMEDNQDLKIALGSHTDAVGNSKANMALSEKRAKASAAYIVSLGIGAGRLESQGFGETELINECEDGVKCPAEKHSENRRTEFKITGI